MKTTLLRSINDTVNLNESIQFSPEEKSEIAAIKAGDKELEMDSDLYDKLFNYFSRDMPYGTQKARTGDPDEWILAHLDQITLY